MHQPAQKRHSCRRERCPRRDDEALHQRSQKNTCYGCTSGIRRSKSYASGDPSSPSNFSQLFLERLQPTLDASQSVDQAGFRLGLLHDGPLVHIPATQTEGRQRHSTQFSTAVYGGPCENWAFKSATYKCSQSATTRNEQHSIPTSKADSSTLSEGTSQKRNRDAAHSSTRPPYILAKTEHGLQLRSSKTKAFSNTTSKARKHGSSARNIKYFGQLIT